MVEDARFEDADDGPVRLRALDTDDLQVVSALMQDAIFPITEMKWDQGRRRFAILLNRFRWEDQPPNAPQRHDYERVQSVLAIEDVQNVSTQGVDRSQTDMVLSILSLSFEPGDDGMGRLEIILAGDGAIGIDVEALEVVLQDVTRPYVAPSRHMPSHS